MPQTQPVQLNMKIMQVSNTKRMALKTKTMCLLVHKSKWKQNQNSILKDLWAELAFNYFLDSFPFSKLNI